ncbi:hypothetical protein BgiBS90_028217 [Biomphalaria glabrata]|nr:hypothetical protein BgiBS90_028217 [Biomphalaria glabrata]
MSSKIYTASPLKKNMELTSKRRNIMSADSDTDETESQFSVDSETDYNPSETEEEETLRIQLGQVSNIWFNDYVLVAFNTHKKRKISRSRLYYLRYTFNKLHMKNYWPIVYRSKDFEILVNNIRVVIGDLVVLRQHVAGRNKIADRYGSMVYTVLAVPPESGGYFTVQTLFGSKTGHSCHSSTTNRHHCQSKVWPICRLVYCSVFS